MTTRKNFSLILWLLFMIHFGNSTHSSWATSSSHLNLDANRVSWSDLSFQSKNLLVAVRVDVELAALSTSETDTLLIGGSEEVRLRPSGSPIYLLSVNTAIDPVLRSTVTLTNQAWFDPMEATALRRIRLRRGKNDDKKTYRFTRRGVNRLRIQPSGPQEASLEPERWNDVKETLYSYDLTKLGCAEVSEPSVLIYVVSAAALAQDNEPASLCVFGNTQLHHVRFWADGLQALRVDYAEKTKQTALRKKGTVQALRIVLEAQSMNTDQEEPESFSFLGLKKDIAIYIDPTSRIPLQVSGTIPEVGKVNLKLREAGLRQGSD